MAAPSAPSNVNAFGGVEQATIEWTVPDNGGSPITSFTITPFLGGVQQSSVTVSAGALHTTLDPTPGSSDSYTLTGLLIGRYSFSVAATNASGLSPATKSTGYADIIAPPAAPPVVATPVPRLKLPIALAPGGSFATVQQDTLAEVAQSVEVILGTTVGMRPQVPSFGIPGPLFAPLTPSAAQLTQAVEKWEPRARVTIAITENPDGTASVNAAVALANGGTA